MAYEYRRLNLGSIDYVQPGLPQGNEGEVWLRIPGEMSDPHNSRPDNLSEVHSNLAGSGTENDPYRIKNDWELQSINEDLTAHYELWNPIDCSGTQNWDLSGGYNNPKGFNAIGDPTNPFTGSFNGNGFLIKGLTIDLAGDDSTHGKQGLFGVIDGANVTNVALEDIYVRGGEDVGTIAGVLISGNISNSYAKGQYLLSSGYAQTSGERSAGFVARIEQNGAIQNSYSECTLIDYQYSSVTETGGFVGVNKGEITDAYSTGDITPNYGGGISGGFVGLNEGVIQNAYSEGNVLLDGIEPFLTGGFAGSNMGTIRNAYSIGDVGGDLQLGGFTGSNSGLIEKSFAEGQILSGSGSGFAQQNNDGGTISQSYCKMTVNNTGAGFVEDNRGQISDSYTISSIGGGSRIRSNQWLWRQYFQLLCCSVWYQQWRRRNSLEWWRYYQWSLLG